MRAIRNARKVSIRELEQRTGLNRGYLSRLERGEIRETAEHKVAQVASALDVPQDVLELKEKP
ncbi:helix-turn-helix domain-containing protein [Streptomyces tricolor]|uniref:helix-turn-helix domain-containing protein n=1 Tax=Streptomyces tricolor TaxID=68277 RepID=UPI0038049B61